MAHGKTLQSTIELSGVLSPSLQAAINGAVDRLADMAQETLDTADAASRLVAEMDAQEDILKAMQKAYAGYAASGEESSEQAQDLADRIRTVSQELDDNRDVLKAAEKAASRLTDTQDEAADTYSKLERKISSQEDELAALRRQYANVALEQGESSDEARQLANRISDLSGELNQNKQKLNEAERAADSFGKALDNAGEKAESSSEGYTVLKNVIANLSSEAISKAVEGFKELALEGDTALGKLEARTGAAGKKMEGFEDVMYEVYNSNYGESLGDVSEKLSTVIQMTDNLDNASLAKVTKNAIALEDVFGFDVTESMRTVNSLMDQFGITSDQAFSLVVQGAQNGLNQNDDLLDTINEYSVQFKNAGYSADDMFNMLANGVESGTWSVDKLGDAVKEFNIRMSDGSAKDAVEALGFSWESVSERWSKGGDSAKDVFNMLFSELDGLENTTDGYNIGVGLMGTMYEDLGQKAVLALSDTEGAIKSTSDAMSKVDSAAYDTLEGSLSQLGRTIKAEVIQPISEKLTPIIKDGVDFVTSKVGPTVDLLTEKMPALGAAIGIVGAAIAGVKIAGFISKLGKLKNLLKGGLGGDKGGGLNGDKGGGGIFSIFKQLAEMKTKTVLKGMANLSIILVGLGALTAVFALVAPAVTELCDGKQFATLIVGIGLMGLVGTGLAKLAGIVGKIPVSTVAKGLANIAIIMVGMGALTAAIALVAPHIIDLCDSGTYLKMLTAISITGVVGSALAALAGMIGMIPIPAVLAGLANIALALGGFTAIVAAFAALNKIDGFKEFMTSGGDLLSEICRILGEVVGSIIGGIGEGVTNSLPAIGDDLSAFAESLQPMFAMISGADMSGLKSFAGALAALIAVLAGEKLVGFITGGIDYEGLGKNLNTMATNLSGFFGTIMAFPEGGFERANALFECLANVNSLPKEGGVVGWFQGEVDYSKMATGLNQLAGTVGFFTAIQGIPDGAFPKAKAMFECLAGIKSLPKEGGVVGWFQGEVDFGKMASGIQILASPGMIASLIAISTIPANAYTSLTSMFGALAGIKSMPKEGGVVGWFAGNSSTGLTNVSNQLPQVATGVAAFFTNLGGRTDFTPIKNLFDTLSSIKIDSEAAEKGFWSGKSDMEKMGTALSSFATNGSTFFTMINGLNLSNLTSFWTAMGGAAGLPADLASLNGSVGTELSGIVTTFDAKMTEIEKAMDIEAPLTAMQITATSKFRIICAAIKEQMADAKAAVISAVKAMKNTMNFTWNLPKLKMPHIKVSGRFSVDPPTAPQYSVSWYKEGGIMTRPTVFGASGNTLLAGGEAGAEAILPLKVLWEKMEAILRRILSGYNAAGEPTGQGLTSKAGQLLALDNFSLGSLANNTNVVIYYDFSNFTWSPQIHNDGKSDDEDDLMARLRAHEAEFFDWLEEFIQMREVAQYA
jgi:phage-related minor tail protein